MAEIELRVESWGFRFDFLIEDDGAAVDISAATTKKLIFTRPDGTQFDVTASFKTNGTDGYLRWTPSQGDIRKQDAGIWYVEAYLEGISNWNGPSRPASFSVLQRLSRRSGT